MFERFLKRLAKDVNDVLTTRDCDHPTCPNCGGQMTFHGGDLDYGDGYWDCDSCDYSFTEDDMNNA